MIAAGYDLIRRYEQCRLVSYDTDGSGTWTIGWGHTGPDVHPGMSITRHTADVWLTKDVAEIESHLKRVGGLPPLNPYQHAAIVDFVYNLGIGHFLTSTLLAKLREGDWSGAAAEFPRWNEVAGEVNPDLVARRAAEVALFQTKT